MMRLDVIEHKFDRIIHRKIRRDKGVKRKSKINIEEYRNPTPLWEGGPHV